MYKDSKNANIHKSSRNHTDKQTFLNIEWLSSQNITEYNCKSNLISHVYDVIKKLKNRILEMITFLLFNVEMLCFNLTKNS